MIEALQAYLAPRLSAPDGVFVLDATGFPKQGKQSVGVARQYCSTLGKMANCQVGVFLAYVSERGHALVDRRLYLPREWTDDPARCRAAGVPDDGAYQSQAEPGLAMLRPARRAGHLVGRWVTADEDYGKVPEFRDALDAEGWWYVLEVPATAPVSVRDLAAVLSDERWQVLTVAKGAQGPRTYPFAAQQVWESRDGLPERACWLGLRRNLDGSGLKHYLSNAPADTPLATLGSVGAMRWPIETEFQTDKGESGLDEYEVRSWAGWHHHTTLALLASAFLLTVQQDWGEKGARGDPAPGQPRAPGAAATSHLEPGQPARLAQRHPAAQRPRQTVTRQAALAPAP